MRWHLQGHSQEDISQFARTHAVVCIYIQEQVVQNIFSQIMYQIKITRQAARKLLSERVTTSYNKVNMAE